MIKVKMENIGVLKHAEIALDKPLTVFTGPNNSGKTYAAFVLYGMMSDFFSQLDRQFSYLDSLKWEDDFHKLSDLKFDFGKRSIGEVLSQIYCFGVNKFFDNRGKLSVFFSNVFVSSENGFEESNIEIELANNLFKSIEHIKNDAVVDGVEKQVFKLVQDRFLTYSKDPTPDNFISLVVIIEQFIVKIIFNKVLFFPVERGAITMFSRELLLGKSTFVDTLSKIAFLESNASRKKNENVLELIKNSTSRYALPIADALQNQEKFDLWREAKSEYYPYAQELEERILKSVITVNKQGAVEFSIPNSSKSHPYHLSSSLIKSLASIVLYVKHQARRGDYIFIDEPEINLHPDNQILVARWLAKLANNGINIVVSTHSDYIIREFNNLILLGSLEGQGKLIKLKKDDPAKTIDEGCYLKKENVGAYFFNEGMAESLAVDDYGFEVKTIDDATRLQNRLTNSLIDKLEDLEDEK